MPQKKKNNYSYKTSLPAYLSNAAGKLIQAKLILYIIGKHRGKRACIKEIQKYLRDYFKIILPQSTISGRIGDLRQEGKVGFYDIKEYQGYRRKVWEILKKKRKYIKPKTKPKKRKPSYAAKATKKLFDGKPIIPKLPLRQGRAGVGPKRK